jgi:DNA-binding transcriptional regulator YhcF (GntR family)
LAGLEITIDRDGEIPMGVQLVWALRARIRDGVFQPEQRLPGMREVAEATGLNVNTVRTVYQRLEQEGLIESHQGSGTFVASAPQVPSPVSTIAAAAAREASETGVDPREVAAALFLSQSSPLDPPDSETGRRRMLREQIGALERTVAELEAKHPGVAPAAAGDPVGGGPMMLDAAQLERVWTLSVRRLAIVQAAIDNLQSAEGVPEEAATKTAKRKRAARSRASSRPAPAGA